VGKLNQIIAVEKGVKSRVYGAITELHKAAQKSDLFHGFAKDYQPKDEEGEKLPAERKRVQYVVSDVLRSVERLTSELMQVTARKDWTNCVAKGNVEIDGIVLIKDAPVPFLLFLEKQLTDMRTFVSSLPVLDEAEKWDRDENDGLYKTEPTHTHRTKKVQKPIVKYPATEQHPAQTEMITEDIIAGYWKQVKQSGAMPRKERQELFDRVEKLLNAVKHAREAANMADEIEAPDVGVAVFGYLLE
jgi:hypothetical protein